jgi:hypothetical protein
MHRRPKTDHANSAGSLKAKQIDTHAMDEFFNTYAGSHPAKLLLLFLAE